MALPTALRLACLAAALALVAGGCQDDLVPNAVDTAADTAATASRPASPAPASFDTLRVMTYNIEDVRTRDLLSGDHPRLKRAAVRIQHLRPDILLINEITVDQPGDPGYPAGADSMQNARRFAEQYLAVAQADTLAPLRYQPFMAQTNTGQPSGFDLNNDGRVVTDVPDVPPSPEDGGVPRQTDAGRAYGNDAWGFGTFPGQYGMALFVREGLDIVRDSIRTFRLFRWSEMPDALRPTDPETGEPWYSDAEWSALRLSSKSHWDVPVRVPVDAASGGASEAAAGDTTRVLHVLASHPTPPSFDGPERRNVFRNHDEIRFWGAYLDDAAFIEDDSGRPGGLDEGEPFVLVGDLNADPDEGSAYQNPVGTWLLSHPRVNGDVRPRATVPMGDLDPDDTARWGLGVDYALPSQNLRVVGSGIYRPTGADTTGVEVSDHFPVWVDVTFQ